MFRVPGDVLAVRRPVHRVDLAKVALEHSPARDRRIPPRRRDPELLRQRAHWTRAIGKLSNPAGWRVALPAVNYFLECGGGDARAAGKACIPALCTPAMVVELAGAASDARSCDAGHREGTHSQTVGGQKVCAPRPVAPAAVAARRRESAQGPLIACRSVVRCGVQPPSFSACAYLQQLVGRSSGWCNVRLLR